MDEDAEPEPDDTIAANDNQGPLEDQEQADWEKVNHVAMTLARVIGRRMAREDFARLTAANDNGPL